MRKEPARRYASVGAFAQDIRRHLEGLPVEARTDTFGYRAGKFVRRHRAAVAAAAIVVAALAGGLAMTLREARHARAAESRAERRFDDVRRLANSFLFEIHDLIRDLPGSTPARQLLVKRALEYLDSLAKERGDDPSLVRELAAAYQKVGDVQGNPYQPNLGDLQGGWISYRKAIDLLVRLTDRPAAAAEDRSALASACLTGCGIPLVLGEISAAVAMSARGLSVRQALLIDSPRDPKRKRDLSTALRIHAYNLSVAGRHAEAADALKQQAAILGELLAERPEDAELRGDLGQNRYVTGIALKEAGDRAGARSALLEAEGLQRGLVAAHPNNGTMRRNLFWSLTDGGILFQESNDFGPSRQRYQEALEIAESLSRADPTSRDGPVLVAIAYINRAELLQHLGDPGAALRDRVYARSVLEPLVKADPSNAWVVGILADLYIVIANEKRNVPEVAGSESSCDLYRKGLALFDSMKTAGRLAANRESSLQRARDGSKTCTEQLAASSP